MNEERLILVPANLIDTAQKLMQEKHPNSRWQYQQRLEAARDYCNEILDKVNMFKEKKK